MPRLSAGLLAYRLTEAGPEVLLVHPGGPYWRNRDLGAWSIPKGEYEDGQDSLAAALRECREELGAAPEPGEGTLSATSSWMPLAPVKQKGGKVVRAWAVAWDWDPATIASNTFTIEWPPRSRRTPAVPPGGPGRSPRSTGRPGSRWTRPPGAFWTASGRSSRSWRGGSGQGSPGRAGARLPPAQASEIS